MRITRGNLLLALAAGIGLSVFVLLYDRAFPQAAVDVELTREEALAQARSLAKSLGAPVDTMNEAMVFEGETTELIFLQRTIGLDEAIRWARREVPIWNWAVRWFRPEQKEEWEVGLALDGKVVRIAHLVEDAAPGASLPKDSAQALTEAFLRGQGWDLATLDLVESTSRRRERRVDHRFTWEKRGSTIEWRKGDPKGGSGTVRLEVEVQGERVGRYRHFLKVPEDFERALTRTTSLGGLIAITSFALTLLLAIASLVISVARHKEGTVQWRPAFVLAGVTGLVLLFSSIAAWPQFKYAYETDLPWAAFIGFAAFGLLLLVVMSSAMVVFTTAAGESLARQYFPASLRGFRDLLAGRLRSREVAEASLRGYAVGFGFLGYLTLFYLFARRYLGAWMPAEGPQQEYFDQWAPFLVPLTAGVVAAVQEEIAFRLFGISLLKRLLKSTVVAVLLTSVVWGFAHANYPVFPNYVRGLELTIGGVMFGLVFLKYGIVACMVAHFVINAVQAGMPLLSSGNPYYAVSGLVVMALALVPAGLALLRKTDRPPEPVSA
jgi:hypothetical protein